jgi:hypothetical protein
MVDDRYDAVPGADRDPPTETLLRVLGLGLWGSAAPGDAR